MDILSGKKINRRTVYFFKAKQQSNTLIGKISVLGFHDKATFFSLYWNIIRKFA